MLWNQIFRSFVTAAFVLVVSASCGSQTSKRETSETLIRQAAASFAAGDFQKNADLLSQAAGTDPHNPKVWWKLCEAYQLTEELDLAVKA